jgi:hypothetical protein
MAHPVIGAAHPVTGDAVAVEPTPVGMMAGAIPEGGTAAKTIVERMAGIEALAEILFGVWRLILPHPRRLNALTIPRGAGVICRAVGKLRGCPDNACTKLFGRLESLTTFQHSWAQPRREAPQLAAGRSTLELVPEGKSSFFGPMNDTRRWGAIRVRRLSDLSPLN